MSVYATEHHEHQSVAQSSYDQCQHLADVLFSSSHHQTVHRQSVCHLPSRTAFPLGHLSPLSEELAHYLCVDAVGNIAPTFFFASAMFNFVVLLHNLVSFRMPTSRASCASRAPAIPPHKQQHLIQQCLTEFCMRCCCLYGGIAGTFCRRCEHA